MTKKPAKPPKVDPVIGVRLPPTLVRQLDRAAKQCGRNRSSEMRMRLAASLASTPVLMIDVGA
jgi:hypothetical protein